MGSQAYDQPYQAFKWFSTFYNGVLLSENIYHNEYSTRLIRMFSNSKQKISTFQTYACAHIFKACIHYRKKDGKCIAKCVIKTILNYMHSETKVVIYDLDKVISALPQKRMVQVMVYGIK